MQNNRHSEIEMLDLEMDERELFGKYYNDEGLDEDAEGPYGA